MGQSFAGKWTVLTPIESKTYCRVQVGGVAWAATPHKHWLFEESSQIRLPHASAKSFLYAVLTEDVDSNSESDSN